jgi:hypothetical protein
MVLYNSCSLLKNFPSLSVPCFLLKYLHGGESLSIQKVLNRKSYEYKIYLDMPACKEYFSTCRQVRK